jgi:hypothetical protein
MPRRPGWAWARLATIPTGGEEVLVDCWWLEVDHNAIQRLRLRPRTQPTGASNDRSNPSHAGSSRLNRAG